MTQSPGSQRWAWLGIGIVLGLAAAWVWPHEPAHAAATDRSGKFALTTCEVGLDTSGTVEGIFCLDFLTGRLTGCVINTGVGKFTNFYFRNIAADFNLDPKTEPNYSIISGKATMNSRGAVNPAAGVLYIGELSSGKVICYAFPYRVSQKVMPPVTLLPIDGFSFREAQAKN